MEGTRRAKEYAPMVRSPLALHPSFGRIAAGIVIKSVKRQLLPGALDRTRSQAINTA